MADDEIHIVPGDSRRNQALDLASKLVGALDVAVPGLGGVLGAMLGGWATERKIERVTEVVNQIAVEFHEFKSEYIKTDEFAELFEKVLRQAAEERNDDKRRLYRNFIINAIRQPNRPYDERVAVLRALEELHPDHLRLLDALAVEVRAEDLGYGFGSPHHTLSRRLGNIREPRLAELVQDLNRRGLTKLERLMTTMTASGAEDLRSDITRFGWAVLEAARGSKKDTR